MSRSHRALLVALGIDNFGSGLFLPLSLVFVTRVIGLPLGLAGTVVAIGTLVGLLIPPLAGRLGDRIGARQVVIGAELVQAAGAGCYLLADDVAGTILATVLLAAGQQAFYSSLFALIADTAGDGAKDRPFARANMVRAATFGLGALAAGVLITQVDRLGLQIAVAVDAVSFVACAVLLAALVQAPTRSQTTTGEPSARRLLRDRPYLALIAAVALIALVSDFFLLGLPVYLLDTLSTPAWLPGAALALLTVASSTAATTVVHRTRHLARTTAIAIGAGIFVLWCALSLLAAALPPGWTQTAWVLATTLVLAAGGLMFGVRANALAEAAAPRAYRGRYLAGFQYAFTVPGVVAPGLVGLFSIAVWLPWLVVALCAAAGACGVLLLSRHLPAYAVKPASELSGAR